MATAAERAAYVNAVLGADTLKGTADMVSYFDKQDQTHSMAAQHGGPAFLPGHREMMNRYEVLLRETDPVLTLLYWDWTTDPANTTCGVNLMTTAFMGAANGVVAAPFSSLHANGVGANSRAGTVYSTGLTCAMHTGDWTYPPPQLYRAKSAGLPGASSDTTVLSRITFPNFGVMENNPHGTAHGYMSAGCTIGNIGNIATAAQAPFFFLLHANCNRLWAMGQRNSSYVSRRAPASVYGTSGVDPSITGTMPPWDGSSGIPPWTSTPGDCTCPKTAKDASNVDPPVYNNGAAHHSHPHGQPIVRDRNPVASAQPVELFVFRRGRRARLSAGAH